MKKFFLVLLVIAAVGGVYAYYNLGGAVRAALQTAATEALGTPVHIGLLAVSLGDKSASLGSLTVDAPKGFHSKDFLKTKKITVAVGEVTSQVVTLREVDVDGMKVIYDIGLDGTNLDAIERNMKRAGGGSSVTLPKVIIQKLRITHARIVPDVAGVTASAKLADITMENIGTPAHPVTVGEASSRIMDRIVAASSNALVKSGLTSPLRAATKGIKGLFSK